MKKALYVLAAAVIVASTMVVAAQHGNTDSALPSEMKFMHDACGPGDARGQTPSHIPDHLSQALELTPAQSSEIDRLAAEGCATIIRTHQQILDLLTPEQRATIAQMHSDGSAHAYLMELFKKLHGGK
jgi:Spy/CpxP family protein refolding chaperone